MRYNIASHPFTNQPDYRLVHVYASFNQANNLVELRCNLARAVNEGSGFFEEGTQFLGFSDDSGNGPQSVVEDMERRNSKTLWQHVMELLPGLNDYQKNAVFNYLYGVIHIAHDVDDPPMANTLFLCDHIDYSGHWK